MATTSSIEWTDTTWNPVVGCEKVSPGCAHCYAETMAKRLRAMAEADIAAGKDPGKKRHYIDAVDDKGRWSGKLIPVPEALGEPIRWKKPRRVFVNSMSDLFHESVPFEFVDKVFAVMNATTYRLPLKGKVEYWHTYQVLTKRPARMAEYMLSRSSKNFGQGKHPLFEAGRGEGGALRGYGFEIMNAGAGLVWPPSNVWIGTSVENQKCKSRIDELRNVPAAVRFLSLEPLLEDLGALDLTGIHWVIVGGESGHNARPCDLGWIRSIVGQCKTAGVPCFVKQVGAWPVTCDVRNGTTGILDGYPVSYVLQHDTKGGDWNEWPADLRVRDWPKGGE